VKGGILEIQRISDWEDLVRAKCTEVPGQLFVSVPDLAELAPAADTITAVGSLTLANTSLTTFSLPALTRVDGTLHVLGNTVLARVSLPVLARVGVLQFKENEKLSTISLPALTEVDDLMLFNATYIFQGVTILSLPSLTAVNRDVYITWNNSLTTLALPALTTVKGALTIFDNSALRQCAVTGVRNQLVPAPGSYEARGNTGIPDTCP
jgi:hypothetical protein